MSATTFAKSFLAEGRAELAVCSARGKHSLARLSDDQVWRPRAPMDSVGDLVLHLCSKLRRRIPPLAGGAPDGRHGAKDSSERGPIPKAELLLRLEEAVGAADAVLAGLDADRLLEEIRYRGPKGEKQATVLAVVLRTLLHLGGHVQEVVDATRLQLGDAGSGSAAPGQAVIAADNVVFERGMIPAAPPADERPAEAGPPREESPLYDPLLELEQEYQDQEREGKV
jgi:DinB superfamily